MFRARLSALVFSCVAVVVPGEVHAQTLPAALPAWDKVPLAVGKEKPDLVLTGTVTRRDYQRNVPVSFDVPKGVTRMGVELTYTRPDGKTVINLGLFDGERFRGWSRSEEHTSELQSQR